MKALVPAALASFLLAACAGSSPAAAVLVAPTTPEALAAPGDQIVLLKARAVGVQIYVCAPKAGAPTTFEWSLKGPEAELTDDAGAKIGGHHAGPTWESVDGSKVVGKKQAQAEAPEAGAIPWLLLTATSNEGAGLMTRVKTIQRVDTHGGKAPAEGCDAARANAEARVPYTASYYFHGAR